jgi:hypothetical protein
MKTTPTKGMRVKITGNSCGHPFEIGGSRIFRVTAIDNSDNTVRLAPAGGGEVSSWIPFDDITAATSIGWEWLQSALPPEAVELLHMFDGLDGLTLNPELAARVVLKTPNLKETLFEIAVEIAEEVTTLTEPGTRGKRRRFLP